MDCYKALNKELITEIQTMKAHISFYQKELNTVRRDMLQERTMRVEQEQLFLTILTKNYCHMVSTINPNVNLPNLIDMEINCRAEENEEEKYKRLSTDEILENLRNSNQLQNARRSLVRMSPIAKRKSGDLSTLNSPVDKNAVMEESSLIEVEDPDDDEDNDHEYDDDNKREHEYEFNEKADIDEQTFINDDCTAEEEEEGERDYVPQQEDDDNDENEQCGENTEMENLINATEQLYLLENIFEEEDEIEAPETIVKKKSKEYVTSKRTIYSSPLHDITNCDELVFRSTPEDMDNSMISTLPSFHTSGNHLMCSSTPRSTGTFDDMFSEIKNTNVLTYINDPTADFDRTTRPKRNCRPNNLKETNLRNKLRNEGDSLRSNRRSKKKSKSIPTTL